jgi:mRNA interferase RelE/StbE
MTYSVLILKSAQKNLSRLDSSIQGKIIEKIRNLADNPRPSGTKKLAGRDAWRIRLGDYRIIYEINDDELIILVVVIGHRREVYK